MWHLGKDSLTYYNGDKFYISTKDFQKTVYNIYSKQFGLKNRIRIERPEYPRKEFVEVMKEKLMAP